MAREARDDANATASSVQRQLRFVRFPGALKLRESNLVINLQVVPEKRLRWVPSRFHQLLVEDCETAARDFLKETMER